MGELKIGAELPKGFDNTGDNQEKTKAALAATAAFDGMKERHGADNQTDEVAEANRKAQEEAAEIYDAVIKTSHEYAVHPMFGLLFAEDALKIADRMAKSGIYPVNNPADARGLYHASARELARKVFPYQYQGADNQVYRHPCHKDRRSFADERVSLAAEITSEIDKAEKDAKAAKKADKKVSRGTGKKPPLKVV